MKKLLIFVFAQLVGLSSYAQTAPRESFSRNSFWTETVINGVIKNKWRWQMDYQYRRMSDATDVSSPSHNLFKNSFQHVYRPWVHYQMNDNVRFSLSPLGFWETFTPAVEASGTRKIQPEFRICPQITLTNKIGRITFDHRYRHEFRFLGTKVNEETGGEFGYSQGMDFPNSGKRSRLRYFLRTIIPLGNHQKLEEKTFYIIAWNEVFLSMGQKINSDKLWDQNRSFCLLGYKPAMSFPMRFEVGYGMQYANRITSSYVNGVLTETGNKLEKNNIFQIYIIVENFNNLFKSKN